MSNQVKVTQPIQVRVLEPNTMRSYAYAARDFESVTGIPVHKADKVSIASFQASMEGRKLSVGTIRLRLSAVSMLSGVKVELPKRQKPKSRPPTLNAEQVRIVMSLVTHAADRLTLVKLLTLGSRARSVNAQQATRLVKRYVRKAGLNDRQASMRVWCASGRQLLERMTATELANTIGTLPDDGPGIDWRPLHGINRRKRR